MILQRYFYKIIKFRSCYSFGLLVYKFLIEIWIFWHRNVFMSRSSLPLINLCTNVWGIYVIFVVLIVNLSSENFIGKSLVACINWRAGWTWTAMLDTCKGWWQVLSTSCSHWGSLKGGCCFNAANYTLLCWPNSRLWYIGRAISIHQTQTSWSNGTCSTMWCHYPQA